jgi:hypothetical protein
MSGGVDWELAAGVARALASEVTSGVAWTVTCRMTFLITLETTQEVGGESQFQTRDSEAKCPVCCIYRVVGRLECGQARCLAGHDNIVISRVMHLRPS